jgi:hypothetical protein
VEALSIGGLKLRRYLLLSSLLLAASLAIPALVQAQEGLFIRNACTDITSPVTNRSFCFQQSDGTLRVWNGSAWSTIAGGSGDGDITGVTAGDGLDGGGTSGDVTLTIAPGEFTHGELDELSDDDHSAIYVKFEVTAGAPAAGSCDRDGQLQVDTTNEAIYYCSDGAGGNPRNFASLGDAYNQMTGDSGSATASGSETFRFVGGVGITATVAAGSPDQVTHDIDNHVKSIYFPAAALSTDGTQCAAPAEVTINSGPKLFTIICTDNDASTIHGSVHMPDSWNAGTVTFAMSYIQTAADTAVMNSDIAAQCRGNGETPSSTYGTEVAIDDAAVTGSNANDITTSAAVTATGTCAAGDMLYWRWQLDATGTTTAVATLNIVGFKMEYTVTGAGSD